LVHPLERLLLPAVRAGGPVERLDRAEGIVRELDGRRALGAEPAEGVGRVGITLDVDDLVALGIDELTTAHRTVRADAPRDLRLLELERGGRGFDRRQVDSAPSHRHSGCRRAAELEKVPSREVHGDPPWLEQPLGDQNSGLVSSSHTRRTTTMRSGFPAARSTFTMSPGFRDSRVPAGSSSLTTRVCSP